MRRKNNLFKKANRLSEIKLKYKRLRNKVLSQMRLDKAEYFRKRDPRNPKQFLKTVKILNKQGPSIPVLSYGFSVLSLDQEKANATPSSPII